MKNTKTVIKHKPKKIAVATLAIMLLAISFLLLSSSLNINVIQTKAIFSYNETSQLDYNVSLKKNNYFEQQVLPSGQQYITSIIDNVNMDYKYNFSATHNFSGVYSYKIYARVSADYNLDNNTSKQVWTKDYTIVEEKQKTIANQSFFSISENVSLNYDKYNKIINNFKRDYMLAINAKVDVIMDISVNTDYNGKQVKDSARLLTSIPLAEQTIEINKEYKATDNGNITTKNVIKRFNNIFTFILGIIVGLFGIIILIIQFIIILMDEKRQTSYIKKLKKYLHDYEDIIATSKEAPKTKGLNVIEVVKFEDIVNAQDDLRVPIIFCETKKNQEGKFYLISQDCAYCYTLSEENTKGGMHVKENEFEKR